MNKKEQHIRDLLRRWTTGEITALEEAELLAAAQHDPFLEEALAAYQAQAEHDHAAHLTRIRKETARRAPVTRSIGRWAAVAASLLLLITVGWWSLRQQATLDMAPVAMEEAVVEEQITSDTREATVPAAATAEKEEMASEAAAPSAPIAGNTQKEPPSESIAPPTSYAAEARSAENAAKDRAQEEERQRTAKLSTTRLDSEAFVLETRDEAPEADELIVVPPASPPPASPLAIDSPVQSQTYSRRLDDPTKITNSGVPVSPQGYRVIEGYVTDTEGFPLIGASILTPGAANGTVTDLDGYYRITVAKEVKSLLISYTGFESTQVSIDDKEQLDVALAEGMALDEVVVTGLGAKKRVQAAIAEGTAQPVGGFGALRDYIASNTPANTPRSRIKVRFLVQADGRLTDFLVLKSTNIGQNSLAIQLLQQGPKWEITEGDGPVETDYVVRF